MTTDVNKQREEEFNKAMAALYNDEKPQHEPAPSPVESPSSPPVESVPEAPESAPEAAEPNKTTPTAPSDDTPPESVPESPVEDAVDLQAEWDKLHPKVREAIEHERRASQSAVGRVAFLNRELDKLKNSLKTNQPQVSAPKANETPAEKKVRLEKLEKLRETDPEYASTIDEMLEELDRRHVEEVGKWQQQVSPLQQQAKELELRLEEQTMDMHAPDWRDAVTSQAFQEWQQLKLPPDERAALGTYTRAKDLLPYINAFKQDWQAYQAAFQHQAPAAEAPPQASTTTADKVAQDRNRKLQQPAVGPSSVPKPNARPVDLSDPETRRKEFERYSASLYST